MEDVKTIVAKNICELRQKKGMTQLDLAEKLNYSDKAVSKWERAESMPDIAVLLQIASLFEVTLDYLVQESHEELIAEKKSEAKHRMRNRGFITVVSVLLVWLIATLVFVVLTLSTESLGANWLTFVYAVPVSAIVWLVLNSIWFNKRLNYLIISVLMWTFFAALYLTFLICEMNIWLIFVLGIPGQIMILFSSGIKFRGH